MATQELIDATPNAQRRTPNAEVSMREISASAVKCQSGSDNKENKVRL
jgi:hypothetical protein